MNQPGPFLRTSLVSAVALALPLLVAACGGNLPDQSSEAQAELTAQMHRHGMMPKNDSASIRNASAPAGAHLTYYGGRVNGATKAIVVLWGTGSYESHITSSATPSMTSFYAQLLGNNALSSWLDTEYNTVSPSGTKTNQHITPGSASAAPVTITPSVTSATITDAQIKSEITAQIAAGHLPAPSYDASGNALTYYAVFFPHGKTISQGGSNSCQAGGFCAYHGTIGSAANNEYYYGVHPDMQAGSGCDTGCGSASTAFGNYTSVASHELVEMITDAEVGNATVNGPPLAWYDGTNGEIGDICNAQQGTYTGCDGQTYTIQLEFSNAQSNCIAFPVPSCGPVTPDFTLSASAVTIQQGNSGSSTLTTTALNGAGTVSLALSGVPAGVTATLGSTSVASGSGTTVSLAVASSVAAGAYSITVTGTEGTNTHTATIALTVGAPPPPGQLFADGFEAGGWNTAVVSGTGAWSIVTASTYPSISAHGGTHWADFNSYTSTAGATARISTAASFAIPSTYSAATLTFWVYHDTGYTTSADSVTAQVSTNGTTWTSVGSAVNRYNATTGWAQATVDLTAYVGQTIYLGFLGTSQYGNDVYVDDVVVAGSGTGGVTTYTVSGTVTAAGAGLSGVTVATTGASATTNASGAFTISGLANGTYTLTPSLSGYTFSPATASVTVSGANVTGVAFTGTAATGGGTLLSDGFEAGGWTTTQVSGTAGAWTFVSTSKYPSISAHGGSKFADFNSYTSKSGSQTRVVRTAPVVIPSNVTTVTMKFWMYHDTGYSTSADKVQAQVAVSGAWANVGTAVARYTGATGWAQATVDLSAYKGKTLQIGFVGISAYGNDEYLDDVLITAQ